MNARPQFTTVIGGQKVHFLHVRSPFAQARPLLMVHGWPSSPLEFSKVLDPLTNPVAYAGVTTFWFTGTAGPSARLYHETAAFDDGGVQRPGAERVTTPTGAGVFPKELYPTSRRIADDHYAVEHWTEFPRGGHFAAFEQPELLVGDLRTFFRGRG